MAATRTVPDDPRLAEAVRRLAGAYEPEAIYLFGSRARGDAREWSDWDLMLVVPDDAPRERRMAEAAYAQLRGLSLPAEIHVYRRSTFERQKELFGSPPAEVLREGVLLDWRLRSPRPGSSPTAWDPLLPTCCSRDAAMRYRSTGTPSRPAPSSTPSRPRRRR